MKLRGIVVTALVLLVLVILLVWVFQRRLIYFPLQAVGEVPPGVETVSYVTADGSTAEAWYLPVAGEAHGSIVVFNGNAGNRSHRLPFGEAMRRRGFSVLLVDYRGYGGNPGAPSESGLAADARAALAHLRSRTDPDRIVYFGESLGAAVAVRLATEAPPAALVLRSPFASLPDIAAVHYPPLPGSLLLRDRYPNVELIAGVDVPVLVIAGTADRIVPIEQSRAVFEAALRPARFVEIPGANHNDFELLAGERVVDEIARFLVEVLDREP